MEYIMEDITEAELIKLIYQTIGRKELENKLKEKNKTFESFFKEYFKIEGETYRQASLLLQHFNFETDIEIITELNDSSLLNFVKAYAVYIFEKSDLDVEGMHLRTKKVLCALEDEQLNKILPYITNNHDGSLYLCDKSMLEELLGVVSNDKFKILCPYYSKSINREKLTYRKEDYGQELLKKMKQISEEKYEIYIKYVVDECIKSINNEIDNNLFDESWMNLVIDRLISDNNISGLINLLDHKVVWNDHKSQNIPLNAENIRNILNALLQNKVDLFEYIKTNREIHEYLRLLTKKDNTLLEIFINFYNYREGENYYLEYILYEEHLIEKEETLNYLISKAKESNNLDSISEYIKRLKYHENNYKRTIMKYSSKEELDKANEVLSRIENAIIELEQHYIKVFSKDNEAQQEYCSYSKKYPYDMYEIDRNIIDLIDYNVSNEEIDKVIATTPIPVLLKAFSKYELQTETFCYYTKQLGIKVFLSKNPEYIFSYLGNDKYYSIIPWEQLLETIDDNLAQIISERIELFGGFIAQYNNLNGINFKQDEKQEAFISKISSSVLKVHYEKEDYDYIKLFRLAISSRNLKYMYLYYCKIVEQNKQIDNNTMMMFIERVIKTNILEYIFLIFTQVIKNDLNSQYKFSFILLNYIYQTNNKDLISIISKFYPKMYTPIVTDILKLNGIELYDITEENYLSYFNELQSTLLNSDDINIKDNLQSNNRRNILARKLSTH